MKKLCSLIGAAGVLIAPNLYASFDGTIGLTGGPLQVGNGGAFNATTTPVGGAPNLGNFLTFCIEFNEHINLPGGPYNYEINSGAVAGGTGGATTTDPNTGLPMDNISIGTAWLYSQFRAGALGVPTATLAGNLQNAIWFLEDESSGVNNALVTSMENALGYATGTPAQKAAADAAVKLDSNGAYGVVALNLYTGTEDAAHLAQDQLAIVPEASTLFAGALLLLPFAAGTLRSLRKSRVA